MFHEAQDILNPRNDLSNCGIIFWRRWSLHTDVRMSGFDRGDIEDAEELRVVKSQRRKVHAGPWRIRNNTRIYTHLALGKFQNIESLFTTHIIVLQAGIRKTRKCMKSY